LRPIVSIIMAAYNAAAYIAEAIASVQNQTFQNWELIIVNDCSTDSTEAIVLSFDDPRIVYHRLPTRYGRPASVRNFGSQRSAGRYIFFFDSDDVMYPDALQSLVSHMEKEPHLSAAYGFLTHMDQDGMPLPAAGFKLIPSAGGYCLPPSYRHTWERVASLKFVASICIMIKRDVLEVGHFFDESLEAGEDIHLYLKLFLHNIESIGIVPTYLIRYRQNLKSVTKQKEKMQCLLANHLSIVEWFYAHPDLPLSVRHLRSFAFCKKYNYVAGICLAQGHRIQALQILLRCLTDSQVISKDWLKVCGTTLPRCLLPPRLDRHLKSFAVDIRDGLLQARIKTFFAPFPLSGSRSALRRLS
jgi:glycosyltransferase involved in cell wall biosynthesis